MYLFDRCGLAKAAATSGMFAILAGCGSTQIDTTGTTSASSADPAPVVTLTASASGVLTGGSVTLQWTSSYAQSCTATGGWSGDEPTTGSQDTAALTATTQFTLTCTGTGGSTSQSVTITVTAAATPSVMLTASPSSVASGGTSTLTWSSSDVTSCTASGGWSGTLATSGSQTTAELTTPTTYSITCTGADGSVSDSALVAISSGAPTNGTASRPSYNTGNGFFVLDGKLYDANGNEFRIRGVDRVHYDSPSQPGLSRSKANTVRIFVSTNYGASVARLVSIVQTQHIAYKEVPIVTTTLTPAGANTSCSMSSAVLEAAVDNWVATASSWTPLNKYSIINIANEWGPANSTLWRDSYVSAIAKMRAAGYLGTLLIDAGYCGEDMADLVNYSGAVFSSDPQKNVMFAYHAYYNTTPANVGAKFAQLGALAASTGAAYAVTEFGPGRDIGPAPTLVTPGEIITNAEANSLGWCAWAWDDNNLSGGASNNSWFSMTLKGPGTYVTAADLTEYGQDVVLNPTYGLSVLATQASVFD